MAHKYSPEIKAFIAANVTNRTTSEITQLVNDKFGIDMTCSEMKSYKANHKLKSGTRRGLPTGSPTAKYPQHIVDYIRENSKGCGPSEMACRLNEKFGTSYSAAQIKGYYGNHKINSGVTGYFSKGNTPPNKGKKGYCAPGSEKGHFKKNNLPKNTKPIGYERTTRDGYVEVKVRMRPSRPDRNDNFVAKHRLIYEKAYGPIPKECVVIFKDGNKNNFDLSNLALISKAESLSMTRHGLFSSNAEITETGIALTRLRIITSSKEKENDHETGF